MNEAAEIQTEWWICQPALADLRDIFEDGEDLDRDDLRAVWEANVGESWAVEDERDDAHAEALAMTDRPVKRPRVLLKVILLKSHYWGRGSNLAEARAALKGAGCGDTRGAQAFIVEEGTGVHEMGGFTLKTGRLLDPVFLGKV